MVQHLIVPVDGSDASWRAVDVAVGLARRADASVDVVEVVFDQHDVTDAEGRLAERLDQHDTSGVQVSAHVRLTAESVAQAVGTEVEQHPEATVVIASHGRGRSAALLGSVTEELLERIFGPVLVVGPHATADTFDGPVIVTVDGSDASESVLPLAAAWGIELGAEPWIVEVADPDANVSADVSESAYPARLARKLAKDSGHSVQFEVLHGEHVHDEVADFASSIGASMIVASTRGRTGMSRFVIGSTAAAIVRHAPCPVLLVRPPHLRR
ncbi:MAG TPA: universal stress protein [Ilumatobacteraceae bacterium]|nr:universal stress protein [Ilumatobacteraceae bacterium]